MGAKAAALAGVQRLKEEMLGYVQKNEELNAHVKELNTQILEMTGKLENEEKERRRLEQSGPARHCKAPEKNVERQQHMIMESEEELERYVDLDSDDDGSENAESEGMELDPIYPPVHSGLRRKWFADDNAMKEEQILTVTQQVFERRDTRHEGCLSWAAVEALLKDVFLSIGAAREQSVSILLQAVQGG